MHTIHTLFPFVWCILVFDDILSCFRIEWHSVKTCQSKGRQVFKKLLLDFDVFMLIPLSVYMECVCQIKAFLYSLHDAYYYLKLMLSKMGAMYLPKCKVMG